MLQLPRSDGLSVEVPPAGPGICETCREPIAGDPSREYCSALCRHFDEALAAHVAALIEADGDGSAPAVACARRRLRAVAAVYDRLIGIG